MSLHHQQLAFTAWIRDPHNSAAVSGIAAQRMDVYRELFFNNILDTLGNAFPVLHKVLDDAYWQQLCARFFAEHQCHTPHLSHVPGEFVEFLEKQDRLHYPWMLELAQWEWSELELFLAPNEDMDVPLGNDPLNDIPVLSSLLRLHACRYPVHQISDEFLPDAESAETCHLLAWRKADDSIGFMQINALSAQIICLMQNNRQHSGQQLLSLLASQQNEYAAEVIVNGGIQLLNSLYNNNIILGSITTPGQETHE